MNTPATLLQSLDHQDEIFSRPFSILTEAIHHQAFPAASIAVTLKDHLIALKAFGRINEEAGEAVASSLARKPGTNPAKSGGVDVTPQTLFDLASVTKAVATTTMAAILYERGLLELDAPVVGTLPEFLADDCSTLDPRRAEVTFRMLLAHSSGLPAYEKLFLKAHTRAELVFAAITMPLSADPGTRAEYSDIGFIILGAAVERIAEEPLDTFCQREIFGPLAMTNSTFNPPEALRKTIPPTADERIEKEEREAREAAATDNECGAGVLARETPVQAIQPGASPATTRSTFRNKIIQGEVQDENASILGGVAGHAGLFSTACDLARFAHAMLLGGRPILRPETVRAFTRREPTPHGTSRALGWDTPSNPSQSGKYFGPKSYGHLGYTGTSLWIDPDRELSITLLTNRTWPDCSNQAIKQIRPKFHDAIIESLPDPA